MKGTGVWPCKMNGCNKQFAREADLKRHQRTTKLHSTPSFPCPQCDANFTRTDALRRHQKSRHNGLVIEPTDDEQPRSPSRTPSLKGKERASSVPQPGPSSYYRSHTATTTPYVPISLPTSSVRTPWPDYPPSPSTWRPPQPQQVYYHSPHYRPHTNAYHTGRSPPPQPPPSAPAPASTSTVPSEPLPHPPDGAVISPCIIDPQLDPGEMSAADVVAAVRAVLLQAHAAEEQEKEKRAAEAAAAAEQAATSKPPDDGKEEKHQLRRPEPMEHILTEDGEPMLNPAELLTQESLASPPPS